MANKEKKNSAFINLLSVVVLAAATFGILLLKENIDQRKREAMDVVFRVVDITEDTEDPEIWGKNFPQQYDSYLRTVDTVRTKHGGSEAFQKLDLFPVWRELFKGYAFAVDYREERGHAYMLKDQRETERVTDFEQPGTCLHCHASVLPAYYNKGVEAGVDPKEREAAIMKGFELINPMPYHEATKLVEHPVTCQDCHNPETLHLRVTRPGFLNGIQRFAESNEPSPHLPSIERWREGDKEEPYNPNKHASRQELRSMVCGQCHVEYYFKGSEKLLTYPWHNGLKMEQIEEYYDDMEYSDWTHTTSKSPMLKAQHPEFETWSQGIHARSGVSCADCHMPYTRVGAVKVSDHQVRSPLLNPSKSCQVCHRVDQNELVLRAEGIQDRTAALLTRGETACYELIMSIKEAMDAGATDAQLKEARHLHRKAQWRLDFVAAENSMGFHAPQETARILGEAIDYARQGQVLVAKTILAVR